MTTNTIEGLRVYQWGFEGTKAAGTLTVDTQPTIGDTFTIGGIVYTFTAVVDADTEGEVSIGANVAGAKLAIVAAINGTDGFNNPHPAVTASAFSGDVTTITARIPGEAGDAIGTTETFTAGTNIFNATTLGATTAGTYARGTSVPATSKMAIEKIEWGDDDENIYRPSFANGLLLRNRGEATAVQHGTRFSFSDQPVVWEQLMHWFALCVKGEPTVTYVDGSPDVYRWVFTRTPTANPQPLAATLERRFSNGADFVDQECGYAMLSSFGLSYAENEHLRMSGEGFARKFATATITGALSAPTAELGVSALSTVYVNDSWATAGDTLLSEQVVGWEWEFGSGLFPQPTAEGRTDLDFTKHQINAQEVMSNLKLTLLLDPTTYAAEAAKAAAGTRRAIQVKVAGSGGRLLTIDGLYQYTKPSIFKIGEQNGQDIVELELEEATDQTNFLSITLDHPSVASLA
jgi:hypothetical protein